MGSDKLPNNLPIEALLKLLEKTPNVENSYDDLQIEDDVLKFTAAFKIEAGETPIKTELLYRIYKSWSSNPVTRYKFTRKLSSFIPKVDRYYKISHNIFKLTKITKELLGQKQKKTPRRVKLEYFRKFFDHYSIKKGNIYIESFILHYLYEEWCDKFNRKHMYGPNSFTQALKNFFDFRYYKFVFHFKVDESILKYLPQTKLDALRKGRRTTLGKKEEQKKQS